MTFENFFSKEKFYLFRGVWNTKIAVAQKKISCIEVVVFKFLFLIGNIIANYRSIGQDAFIRETILTAVCPQLQNRRFCPAPGYNDLIAIFGFDFFSSVFTLLMSQDDCAIFFDS